MSDVAGLRSMTPFMLSNLYLYRYASLFQALYTWHGVPINVWFTTFYKSIKVPSPSPRYRFPPSGYDATRILVRERRTRTHKCTRTYAHRYFCVRLFTRSCKFGCVCYAHANPGVRDLASLLSSPPPHRLIRNSAVPRWDNIWLGDARPDRQAW